MLLGTVAVCCALFGSFTEPVPSPDDASRAYSAWWLISHRDLGGLREMLRANATVALLRSADGRGLLFWAYEVGVRENRARGLACLSADAKSARVGHTVTHHIRRSNATLTPHAAAAA